MARRVRKFEETGMLIRTVAPRRVVRHPFARGASAQSILDEIRRGFGNVPAAETAGFVPRVDVSETEESLLLEAELPGVEKGDFDVVVDDDVITIAGEKKVARPAEVREAARVERPCGEFSRSFRLPFDVDPDSVKGVYRNGVLTVTVPKPAALRPRTIPIAAG